MRNVPLATRLRGKLASRSPAQSMSESKTVMLAGPGQTQQSSQGSERKQGNEQLPPSFQGSWDSRQAANCGGGGCL